MCIITAIREIKSIFENMVQRARRTRFEASQSTKRRKIYYSNDIEGQLSSTYIKYENLALYVASYVVI